MLLKNLTTSVQQKSEWGNYVTSSLDITFNGVNPLTDLHAEISLFTDDSNNDIVHSLKESWNVIVGDELHTFTIPLIITVIAEDESDYEVLREITLKLLLPYTNVGFKKSLARGSGALRRKCRAYAMNLVERGCPYIVVMHDLDDNQKRNFVEQFRRRYRT